MKGYRESIYLHFNFQKVNSVNIINVIFGDIYSQLPITFQMSYQTQEFLYGI
jgi:hypothetical protein